MKVFSFASGLRVLGQGMSRVYGMPGFTAWRFTGLGFKIQSPPGLGL